MSQEECLTRSLPNLNPDKVSVSDFNANRVHFLKVDLDIALTFADIALNAGADSEKRIRNQANARKAYDNAIHLLRRLTLANVEVREVDQKLRRLKSALQELGEFF